MRHPRHGFRFQSAAAAAAVLTLTAAWGAGAASGAAAAEPSPHAAHDDMIGAPAPELSVTRWLGLPERTTLADLQGKVVLVYFWGLWCSPCKDALPEIDALARDLKSAGLEVVTIHTPTKADQVPAWYGKTAPAFAVGLDDGGSAAAWKVANYPTYFLLGRDGKVRSAFISTPGAGEIEPLLAESAGS